MSALEHPTPEQRLERLADRMDDGFQFVVYGDQRALAEGEWQAMVGHIAELDEASTGRPLLFVLDTGDIVQDGRFSDQFHQFREILAPIRQLPYLLAVGNHELANDKHPIGREHTAALLAGSVGEGFPVGPEQLHWDWSHGPLRILSLDSNAILYRRPDEDEEQRRARGEAELRWLSERLDEPEGQRQTVLALHHPFLQSSSKHRDSAIELWRLEHEGRRLIDLLADGGVDLVLTGHTHTYELYRLEREDGHVLWQMNLSGRPRGAWLGLGAWLRRATDIAGREHEWLARKGFDIPSEWSIEQTEAMTERERDQFALFDVAADGAVSVRLHYVGKKDPYELEVGPARALLPAP